MADFVKFNKFLLQLGQEKYDFSNDTLKFALTNTAPTATADAIQTALSDYLNALQIGEDVTVSALYAAAMAVTADLYKPTFSITELIIGKVISPQDAVDIVLDFNEVAYGEIANVIIMEI